jgi:hypothetical protein
MEIQKCNESSSPENYVAIGAHFHSCAKKLTHAAIIIRHKGRYYLHHFPGAEKPLVQVDMPPNGWGVYKVLDVISHDESVVGSVLSQCLDICAQSKVAYSYIGVSGRYLDNGQYVTKTGLPEIATCVGFCVNTLNTILVDPMSDYFQFDDWPHYSGQINLSIKGEAELTKQHPSLDWGLYQKYRRRITVPEYFASSFCNEYPIAKKSIDSIVWNLSEEVRKMFSEAPPVGLLTAAPLHVSGEKGVQGSATQ